MILKKRDIPLLKNFKRLEASSIMESVMAISIISISALIAFVVYLNVIKLNKSTHYYNAKHKVNLLAEQSLFQNEYEDNTYIFKGYSIDKKVTINKEEHTALLRFIIKSGGKENIVNKLISYNEE